MSDLGLICDLDQWDGKSLPFLWDKPFLLCTLFHEGNAPSRAEALKFSIFFLFFFFSFFPLLPFILLPVQSQQSFLLPVTALGKGAQLWEEHPGAPNPRETAQGRAVAAAQGLQPVLSLF